MVDLQQRDPSRGLCAMLEQHFVFTVNESMNSSKALLTLEFMARRSYVGQPACVCASLEKSVLGCE